MYIKKSFKTFMATAKLAVQKL